MTTETQPVANVVWLPREQLAGNDYNPNRVAPPEMKLLKTSIMEDGWTQPIVARPLLDDAGAEVADRYEIVDGFHRWTISGDAQVFALTDGLVPVVVIRPDPAQQRMATIRHNRARGTHHVVRMSEIVRDLADSGLDVDEIRARLSMDKEEVTRLLERGRMTERASSDEGFTEAWRPVAKT